MNIEKILKERQGTVIDVRTAEEFAGGKVAGSINIPLHEIPLHIEELKGLNVPLVFCCASGGRSGQAHRYITQCGLECYNGGSWMDLNAYQSLAI